VGERAAQKDLIRDTVAVRNTCFVSGATPAAPGDHPAPLTDDIFPA
jgi:hypothetical protein